MAIIHDLPFYFKISGYIAENENSVVNLGMWKLDEEGHRYREEDDVNNMKTTCNGHAETSHSDKVKVKKKKMKNMVGIFEMVRDYCEGYTVRVHAPRTLFINPTAGCSQ